MDESNIVSLKDDELLKIFELLDFYSIGNAFETCEKFYNVISNNETILVKKFFKNPSKTININRFMKDPIAHGDADSFYYDKWEMIDYFKKTKSKLEDLLKYKNQFKHVRMNDLDEATSFFVSKMKLEKFEIYTHLSSFSFNFNHQKLDEDLFKENYSIKELTLGIDTHYWLSKYHLILKNCKGVRKLQMPYHDEEKYGRYITKTSFTTETLKIIATNMPELNYLRIRKPSFFYHSMTFENLQTLQIDEVNSVEEHRSWISLALCCPRLKKVVVTQNEKQIFHKNFTIPSENLKELLDNCKNLQKLIIGPHLDITDDFIDTILNTRNKNFWFLQIETENYYEDLERVRKFENSKVTCEVVVPIRKENDSENYAKENFFCL